MCPLAVQLWRDAVSQPTHVRLLTHNAPVGRSAGPRVRTYVRKWDYPGMNVEVVQ